MVNYVNLSTLNRAFQPQVAVIRAWIILRPRTRIDKHIHKTKNSGLFFSLVR